MAHWSEKYVGMAYRAADFDCAALAKRVLHEQFQRDIALPAGRDYHDKQGIARLRAMSEQIVREQPDYARRLTRPPAEGDCVLLVSRARLTHIGVYCIVAGEPCVLHAASTQRQVVLTRVRELERHAMTVEGYYEWM